MIAYLARLCGYVVIPPGTERAVIDGYCVGLAELYRTVPIGCQVAPVGAVVRPPPPLPALGMWRPTTRVSPRFVLEAGPLGVFYASDERPAKLQCCTPRTFDDWARRNHAALERVEVCEMEVEQ